tara:strand:- start:638 stop:862 length:225 start_codon:yes stop_codon:yes gene_type:complete
MEYKTDKETYLEYREEQLGDIADAISHLIAESVQAHTANLPTVDALRVMYIVGQDLKAVAEDQLEDIDQVKEDN